MERPCSRVTRAISRLLLLGAGGLPSMACAELSLIDARFDGLANDTNDTFNLISNAPSNGSGGAWDQATGIVTRGSANNATAGAVSDTTMDFTALSAESVVIAVEIESATGSIAANGIFIGLQAADGGANAGGELWNNLGPSFGLVISGTS
ncbi:MAG: hypothetical protein VCG02_07325, partial [Verrucomicrobiota bacterium]